MALSNEGDAVRAARRAEVREASERSKRIAEASALALALEEEKVALQSEVTPEAKRSKRSKRSMKRSNERFKRRSCRPYPRVSSGDALARLSKIDQRSLMFYAICRRNGVHKIDIRKSIIFGYNM